MLMNAFFLKATTVNYLLFIPSFMYNFVYRWQIFWRLSSSRSKWGPLRKLVITSPTWSVLGPAWESTCMTRSPWAINLLSLEPWLCLCQSIGIRLQLTALCCCLFIFGCYETVSSEILKVNVILTLKIVFSINFSMFISFLSVHSFCCDIAIVSDVCGQSVTFCHCSVSLKGLK